MHFDVVLFLCEEPRQGRRSSPQSKWRSSSTSSHLSFRPSSNFLGAMDCNIVKKEIARFGPRKMKLSPRENLNDPTQGTRRISCCVLVDTNNNLLTSNLYFRYLIFFYSVVVIVSQSFIHSFSLKLELPRSISCLEHIHVFLINCQARHPYQFNMRLSILYAAGPEEARWGAATAHAE